IVENSGEGTVDYINSTVTWTMGDHIEYMALGGFSTINGTGNSLNNFIEGNGVGNTLDGGDGNDNLWGGQGTGVDVLIGGAGADTLNGGDGADTLSGGTGNDSYLVDNTSDVVIENADEGTDLVSSTVNWTLGSNLENLTLTGWDNFNGTGNSVTNVITGSNGNNTLDGGAGNDTLNGGIGADSLIGGDGSDKLDGGTDNDVLYGGDGADSMTGGSGADTSVFEDATAWNNVDTIADFNTGQTDAIDIRDLLDGYSGPVTDWARFSDSGGNTTVEVDRDGTGATYGWTQIATLTGVTGLTDEATLVTNGNLLVS
ncbi:MAG TPA: type I secretion C-terminal target domain-containing protein, partial [Bryobacteraceae bacterium]|nr:type I secretion C-terminal target domain-containing protein [Bryobacteraceae bacterium]